MGFGDLVRIEVPNFLEENVTFFIAVFEVTKPNNDIIKKSVIYSGALDWNSLDSETRNIKEFVHFKRLQKAWMVNSYTV